MFLNVQHLSVTVADAVLMKMFRKRGRPVRPLPRLLPCLRRRTGSASSYLRGRSSGITFLVMREDLQGTSSLVWRAPTPTFYAAKSHWHLLWSRRQGMLALWARRPTCVSSQTRLSLQGFSYARGSCRQVSHQCEMAWLVS